MTLREIIYDVLEHLNAYSDDHKFSKEHIAFVINAKRAMLLSQYMSNLRKEVPLEALQVACMNMEIDGNCFEDIKVIKSTNKVPATIDNTGRSNLAKVYGASRFQKTINVVDYSRLPFIISEPYNKNMLYVAVDPKSYLVAVNSAESHLMLKKLEVEGVYENPQEAWEYDCEIQSITENISPFAKPTEVYPCEFWDEKYPIEASLISPLVMQVSQELLLKLQIPMDNVNNAETDPNFKDVSFRKR